MTLTLPSLEKLATDQRPRPTDRKKGVSLKMGDPPKSMGDLQDPKMEVPTRYFLGLFFREYPF